MLFGAVTYDWMNVSITDPHHQRPVLGFIQSEQQKLWILLKWLEVDIKIRPQFNLRGLFVLLNSRRQEIKAHLVIQFYERTDFRPDLLGGLSTGGYRK